MATTTLSQNNLRNYIALICQMEQNLYRQQEVIKAVEKRINVLSNPYVGPKPSQPQAVRKSGGSMISTIIGAFFAIIGVAGVLEGEMIGGIIFCIIGVPILANAHDINTRNAQTDAANRNSNISYQNELNRYYQNVSYAEAQKKMASILKARLREMKNMKDSLERDLERAYSCGVIYPTYRNLVAVTSFHDYFESRRCDRLEGPNGAYNKFDVECRLDRIITRLDDISRQLDSIKYSQNMLYNIVSDSNRQLERLNRSSENTEAQLQQMSNQAAIRENQLEKLSYNMELINFNADQTRREIELRNRVDGIMRYR